MPRNHLADEGTGRVEGRDSPRRNGTKPELERSRPPGRVRSSCAAGLSDALQELNAAPVRLPGTRFNDLNVCVEE